MRSNSKNKVIYESASGLFLIPFFEKIANSNIPIVCEKYFRQTEADISIVSFRIESLVFQMVLREFEVEIDKYGIVPDFEFKKVVFFDHNGKLREYEDFNLFIEYLAKHKANLF